MINKSRTALGKIWDGFRRERFVWFVLAGMAVFLLDHFYQQTPDYEIVIDLPLVERIVAQWEASTRRTPNPTEINGLIGAHIREEILMREAIARGLNIDDVIIRRRLAQKMEFLLADQTRIAPPDAATLTRYYAENKEAFKAPPRLSFRHIFLGDDLASDPLLAQLRAGVDWRMLGRPFILQREYSARELDVLVRDFGTAFVQTLLENAPDDTTIEGAWFGPVRSAYGEHIVQIVRAIPAQLLPLEAIREQVVRTWQEKEQSRANQAAWEVLQARYRIEFTAPDAPPKSPPDSSMSPLQ